MRLVILGGPGAGKGTQAAKLCRHLAIPWIATGDILRVAISLADEATARERKSLAGDDDLPATILQLGQPANTDLVELGRQAKSYVERGNLVPDELMIEFIRHRLLQPDVKPGWLLDGYPRTAFQAEELNFLLDDLGQRLDWAIWLNVSDEMMRQRSVDRSQGLMRKGSRRDNQPEVVENRIQAFRDSTVPILEYYGRRDRLVTVNGNQSPGAVHQEIIQKLV